MVALPPGQLTFGQIRDLALRRVGNTALVVDGGTLLSQILYETYVAWEWPFLNVTATVSISGPSFVLPPDFLKATDDRALEVVTFDGGSASGSVVREIDPYTFNTVSQPQTSFGRPQLWMADRANGVGLVFPDSTGHVAVCMLRYKRLPLNEIAPPPPGTPTANDAIVPVFPYHLYLCQALFVELLKFEKDARADAEEARANRQFTTLQMGAHPLRSQVPIIPLDGTVFGPTFSGDGGGEDF
jgi:hypothetical protein